MRLLAWAIPSIGVLVGLTGLAAADSARSGLSDSELERILSKGKITRKEDIGTGVTRPRRLWLELDGLTVSAAYKDVDIDRWGVTRFASGDTERHFTDSYKYERAAYLLDRQIDLGMVPVTVIREIHRRPGAVMLWLDNSVSEAERLEQGLQPQDMTKLIYQKADMRLFDALIYNTDRHAANQLHTLEDWQLNLIDHSRAFRTHQELPDGFARRPMTITRSLLAKIEALNEQQLRKLLKRELGPTQIKAILVRRDLILEKLDRDRQEHGDAFVFREEQSAP